MQREEDKKDITAKFDKMDTKFDKMEKKHTETYINVFDKIGENVGKIATNAANIKNNQKKSAGIGGASGLGGGAIILAAKEFWNTFIEGN